MTTNQNQSEITPEELVKLREQSARESLKYWATRSAEDLRKNTESSLFNTGEQWRT